MPCALEHVLNLPVTWEEKHPPPGLWESSICTVSGPGCAGGPLALGSWVPALSEGFCHFHMLVK